MESDIHQQFSTKYQFTNMEIHLVLLTMIDTSFAVPGSTLHAERIVEDKIKCLIVSLYPGSDG